jgi:hypothetical protein
VQHGEDNQQPQHHDDHHHGIHNPLIAICRGMYAFQPEKNSDNNQRYQY